MILIFFIPSNHSWQLKQVKAFVSWFCLCKFNFSSVIFISLRMSQKQSHWLFKVFEITFVVDIVSDKSYSDDCTQTVTLMSTYVVVRTSYSCDKVVWITTRNSHKVLRDIKPPSPFICKPYRAAGASMFPPVSPTIWQNAKFLLKK